MQDFSGLFYESIVFLLLIGALLLYRSRLKK
ncbi:Uncharacterised protein [Helicobacter mustelae]|nr:Uncharacterised protein [Helicobacter mustelae]STP12458.1 Uncharacterised protein [Helicobacter mustelae]